MTATIMYGKQLADEYRTKFKIEVENLKRKGIDPCLAVIIVGDNPASKTYVRMKQKACEQIGIKSIVKAFDKKISEATLLSYIESLNQDRNVHGILVQLPLPDHINEKSILEKINPAKDVDGFHPINIGKLLIGQETLYPCTPLGI